MSLFISRERKREDQAQLDKLRSLSKQADPISQAGLTYHEVCPICPSQLMLNTRRQLYLHLNSREHQARQNEVWGSQDDSSSITASTSRK